MREMKFAFNEGRGNGPQFSYILMHDRIRGLEGVEPIPDDEFHTLPQIPDLLKIQVCLVILLWDTRAWSAESRPRLLCVSKQSGRRRSEKTRLMASLLTPVNLYIIPV
ncbi:unnamed protein product [Caenorhabditis nigoni]